MRRIKMLEYALRVERYAGRLSVAARRPRLTCRAPSSKQLAQPAAQSVPPAKLATLQSQIALTSHKDDASSGSSPRSEGTCRPVVRPVPASLIRAYVCRFAAATRPHVDWLDAQRCDFGRPSQPHTDVD